MEIKRVLHIQLDYQDIDFLKENSEHSFIICRENFKNCDSIEIAVFNRLDLDSLFEDSDDNET